MFANTLKCTHNTRSQDWLVLQVPRTNTDLGNTAFRFFAPYIWNDLQCTSILWFQWVSCDCFNWLF